MMSVQNAPAPLAYVSIDSVVKDEPLDINDAEHNPFASDTGNAEVPPPPTAVPDPPSAANESRRQIDMDILVTVVAKLELMTEKLAAAAFIDQYDQFGKYLVSLLRKIPHRKQHWIKLKLLGEINMALDSNEHQPSNPYPFMLDYQNLTSPIVVEGHTPMQPPPQMNVPVSQGYTVNKANPPPRVRSNERRKRLISNNKASKSVNVTTVSDEDNSVSATELNEPPSKSPSNLSRGKEKPRPSTEPDPTLFKTTANLTLFEDLDRTDSTEEPGPAQGPLYRTDPSLHAMRKTYKSKATKSPRLDSKRIKVSSIHSASRILSGENRNLAKPIPRQTDPSSSNTKPDSSLQRRHAPTAVRISGRFRRKYSPETFDMALKAIEGGMKITTAARKFRIPRSSLFDKVSEKTSLTAKSVGRPCTLSAQEEKQLVEWLLVMERAGLPITRKQIMSSAKALLKNLGKPVLSTEEHWVKRFLGRNPELLEIISQPPKPLRDPVPEENVNLWIQEVQECVERVSHHDENDEMTDAPLVD